MCFEYDCAFCYAEIYLGFTKDTREVNEKSTNVSVCVELLHVLEPTGAEIWVQATTQNGTAQGTLQSTDTRGGSRIWRGEGPEVVKVSFYSFNHYVNA